MPLLWERDGEAYYASGTLEPNETPIRMIVEPLSSGQWDWAVWRLNDEVKVVRTGIADTVQEAMRAAEDAAK